jgi:hypothetical protein
MLVGGKYIGSYSLEVIVTDCHNSLKILEIPKRYGWFIVLWL